MRKKDTLYKVNKHNMPLFIPKENLFDGESLKSNQMQQGYDVDGGMLKGVTVTGTQSKNPLAFFGIQPTANPFVSVGAAQNLSNYGKGVVTNDKGEVDPFNFKASFSKDSLKAGLNAGAGAAIGAGANLVGGIASNLIGGGLHSGAGDAIGSIGGIVGSAVGAVNPLLGAAVSVGSQILGGLTNAAFGTKVDEAKLNAAKEGTSQLNNFTSNAGSFDDVQGIQSVANVQDAYEGGWFTSGDAKRKNDELKRQRQEAMAFAQNSILNNINNISEDQINNQLANYSAYGGPIDAINSGMGAIDYGFISDYLTMKKRQTEQKNKMNNMFMGTPKSMFDFGGDMQTNSADFGTGLIHIGAGGSHEQNPYDGVQLGTDSEGTPNLVEEGEVVFNDYVFSNRIPIDQTTKEKFHFPKKKEITYAEAAKKLEREIQERVNDPISKAGFKAQMQTLEEQQERQKQEMEAERAKAAFEALSPEEQVAVIENAAQQEQMAQEAAMQQEAMAQQQAQPSPEEQAMMQQQMMGQPEAMPQEMMPAEEGYAYGGNLFDEGGYKGALAWLQKKFPKGKNLEVVARVLSKRAKAIGYHGSNKANPVYNWDEAYSSMVGRDDKEISSDNEKLFESLVADGMPRRYAFAYAYPSELGYPFSGEKYAKKHTLAREAAYKKLITDYKEPAKASNTTSAAKPATELTQAEREALRDRMARTQMRDSQTFSPQQTNASAAQSEQRSGQTSKPQAVNNSSAVSEKGINVGKFRQDGNHWNEYGLPGLQNYLLKAEAALNDPNITKERKGELKQEIVNTLNGIQESYYTNVAPTLGKNRQNKSAGIEQHQRMYQDATNNQGFIGVDDEGRLYNRMDQDLDKPVGHNTTDNLATGWVDGYSGPQTWLRHMGASGDGLDDVVSKLRDWGIDYSPYNSWTVGEGDNTRQLYRASLMGTPATSTAETPSGPMIFRPEETTQQSVAAQYGAPWAPENNPSTASEAASNTSATSSSDEAREIVPIHRNDKLRYTGLFGPAVGLGMMAAGIGKPDYSSLDAAVQSGGNVFLADYKPIGNYLTYNPMDIWFEQNRLNAQSRATDRAIQNTTSPSKMAGLLANSYNSQLASGDLYRKALEYNDAKRAQVGEFNRGTDMFNAQAYNQNQQFNASARNRAEQYKAGLAMSAAQQKLAADASWNNSLYGNVAGLFKGIGELGRENYQYNQMVDLLGSGALPGITEDKLVKAGLYRYAKEGGSIKRKKGKRGLTI